MNMDYLLQDFTYIKFRKWIYDFNAFSLTHVVNNIKNTGYLTVWNPLLHIAISLFFFFFFPVTWNHCFLFNSTETNTEFGISRFGSNKADLTLIIWVILGNLLIIRSDQLLSHVRLFVTPWIAARQASLSITNSQSSLRHTSIKSVMPSSHLILCRPLLLLPPIPPRIRVFSNESTLRMRWPKYWSFSFSIIPSKEIPGP